MPKFSIPDSDSLALPPDNVDNLFLHEAFPPPKAKKKAASPAEEELEDEEEEPEDEEPDEEMPMDDEEMPMDDEEEPEEEAPPRKKKPGKMMPGKKMMTGRKVVMTMTTEGKGPEIHSAKAHRCVDKVGAKGKVDNPWAVCTASIGAEGVYARGHGGSASPKRRTRETYVACHKLCPQADLTTAKCRECMATLKEACPYRNPQLAACRECGAELVRESADCRPDSPTTCPNRTDSPKCRECLRHARRAVEAEMDRVVAEALRKL